MRSAITWWQPLVGAAMIGAAIWTHHVQNPSVDDHFAMTLMAAGAALVRGAERSYFVHRKGKT